MAAVAPRPSLQVEDEDAESQTFVAVVEKQGACEFQIRPAVDGTPHLYASPTAESRASGFPDGLNLNHLCVRGTKNVRGDFKFCLRIDVPQNSINPKPVKVVLCFSDEATFNDAARSIRRAQFLYFDSQRLCSQPEGAMDTNQLLLSATRSPKGEPAVSRELLTQEGDGEEAVKVVSISWEELTVESKSAGFFSKRTTVSTVGMPISFISAVKISVPARVADIKFMFSNSRERDVFAYKLFLHAKGDPLAASTFAGPGTLFLNELPQDAAAEDQDPLLPFVAVVEKQGECECQIRPAVDGTPHLYASPTAESRASGFPDGLNLNHLCVRGTKNVRGDFKFCLRIDIPATWSNPNAQKFILCFTNDIIYNRAARSIRQAQFVYFESLRLSSQSHVAMQTNELMLAGAHGVTNVDGSTSYTQDIKVKEGDEDEMLKSVSVDAGVVIIEVKSKALGRGVRSKRSTISTVGIPVQFVDDELSVVIPSRVSDVRFTFADTLQRDLFAFKLFLHSKGHPNFESSASVDQFGHGTRGSSVMTRVSSVMTTSHESRADSVTSSAQGALSERSLYKQGFLNKQGAFVKSWKTRYFVLRPGDLSYFKGKDQAQHGEVPLNTFFLKDATIVEVPFSKHNKSCVFEIQFSTTTGNKDRTLVLEAESEADRAEWVKDLTSHLDTVSDHSRVVALEEVDQVTGLDGAPLSIDDFDLLSQLGQGAWGKVVAARHKHLNIVFALKIMKKKMLVVQGDAKYIIRERKIMSELLHPFILNLHGHFSTPTKLYMVLGLAPGGDMSKMLSKQQHNNYRFTSSVARFVIAQVILAIEYMHGRGILHRDIKTENILIDANGYCVLADMGLACHCDEVAGDPVPQSAEGVEPVTLGSSLWNEANINKHENHLINRRQGVNVRANRNSLLGTPEYLAPEILSTALGGVYGASSDWWAVGILLYELLHGVTPFVARSPNAIYDKIMRSNIEFTSGISPEAQDIIKQLCTKDPTQRLCCAPGRGVDELRQHAFFKDFDWEMLFCRRMPSPFRGSTDTIRSGRNESARDAAQMRQKLDSFVADSLTAEQQAVFEDFN